MKKQTSLIITLAIVLTAAIAFGATEPKAQQCKEITKAGTQCKIMTRDTTRICWIHQRSISAKAAKAQKQ